MDACVSETTSETTEYLVVGDPFFGRNRLRKDFTSDGDEDEDEASSQACLNFRLWNNLPEELLIRIFARLPFKDILRIRSLSKAWRSTITSSQFQQAFADASLVRVALLVGDIVDGTMFLTQEKKEECFRSYISRCVEVVMHTQITATTDGLVCVIENEASSHSQGIVGIRVFVMNQVTGVRRKLPPPSVMTSLPTLVRMDTNVVEGGYTITFIHTKDRTTLEVSSWEFYESVKNMWSKDDLVAMAHLKDMEVFNILHHPSYSYFYEGVATFQKQTRAINVFNLLPAGGYYGGEVDARDPFAEVHNVSGELYKLCMREEQHGVWKRTSTNKWEMVCECPDFEGIWTCLRVMKDLVVLVLKLPYVRKYPTYGDAGTILKVFHLPTKSWHSFPEEEYVVQNWGTYVKEDYGGPFLVEIKFDATP